MSSEPSRVHGVLVRRVGTVLVGMMITAIAATGVGLLIDAVARDADAGEIVRGLGIFVMVGTPFAALVRVAVHGAARRERMQLVYPLATLMVVVIGIVLARW